MNGRRKKQKKIYFTTKRVREQANNMRKKSNIFVQKSIDDLAKIQKDIHLNDLDEESEAAREDVSGDIYNNTVDKIKCSRR